MHTRTFFIYSPFILIIFLNQIWTTKSSYNSHTNPFLGPSDHREAYFNGSSYIRLLTTISLQKHTGLSFRTCHGGELFSQIMKKMTENVIRVSVGTSGLEFEAGPASARYKTKIVAHLLDNRWHTVNLQYRLGNLTLSVDEQTELIANKTFNTELLTNAELSNEGSVLIVGQQFSGCILEGPSIVFNSSFINVHDVYFGACPLSYNNCTVRPVQVDHCSNEPCLRHGECISRTDRYECKCAPRYSGNNCEMDNGPPCNKNPSPCKNGATCNEDQQGDFQCMCLPGFTGKYCESEILIHHLCEPNHCLNNGTCYVIPGTSETSCVCLSGFTGPKCETDINECLSNPCENGGRCIDGPNNYTCNCAYTGYEGKNCEVNINECLTNPCLNGGVCFDNYGSYTCQCQEGFGGENCEQNLNECVSMPCQNRGVCYDKVGGYECKCPKEFSGVNCELAVCDGVPCAQNAECKETASGNRCVCRPGYPGIYPNCSSELGACSHHPCLNGGTCTNYLDSYNCSCPLGFVGIVCESRNDVCDSNPCENSATCIPNAISYQCFCTEGFTGKNCDRYIQCDDNPCQHATNCQDFMGGYYCTCAAGWTGDTCDTSTDHCASHPCQHGATCISTRDRFYCRCSPGFTGKNCQQNINECISMPCLNGGLCIDEINGFYCNCTKDFMGVLCEKPYDICEFKPCKNNGTCSTPNKRDFTCTCLSGFTGKTCEQNIDDCQHHQCPEGRVCKDLIDDYECRCPDGFTGENCMYPVDPCAKTFCQNGGSCHSNKVGIGFCSCTKGFKGQFCEEDIDECTNPVQVCTHGICVNKHGGFQCYCQPGYTGETCNLDFDECLSQPCKHNSTCLNKINNYECVCTPGYRGKDCDEDINECESSPCFGRSTCVDAIASFTCICEPGYTGQLCNINIDDCQSSPCLNGGLCIDGLNSYSCNCSDTGYTGSHCEINIDDCISRPCENGATCIDEVKDYSCKCYPGFTGKNCEVDIDECDSSPCQNSGTCLQRSNLSLYEAPPSLQLPDIFSQPFSIENASGYECICIEGVAGKDCEIDINECDSSPCQRGGTCRNYVGGFKCECEPGTEGLLCEIEINECEKYTPCVHGNCMDMKANYFCDCQQNYGGKNCSVELIGCMENPCNNNGTCKPYVENEIHHKFNCSCPNGFHGETCEKVTTMSLSESSYIVVNTSRDEGYDIQFRFKTTLGDGMLAIGKGLTYYFLELVNGRLNLHSSLLNKWEGVFIGSGLNDSKWQKVFVAINTSHLVLAANEEQTIYPINLNEGSNTTHTSFPTTYLGGTVRELSSRVTHARSAFVGCTEDVIINGEWVLPQNTSWMSIVDVDVGCSRTEQCNPNPCHSGGRCTDEWKDYSCTCERPYLGHQCQYNYTAATFGYENITNSLVTVNVCDYCRRAVRSIVDISMFIRTRQSAGQIFYLGSSLSGTVSNDDNHISAKLESGELLVSILFNGTPESYTVSGVKLDNGFNHLIEVIRNQTLVQVKLNGTEYFRKTIGGIGQLDAQVLYLGGIPESKRPVRQTDLSGLRMDITTSTSGPSAIISPSVNFKGIIQDVQISNGTRRMVVEFFPLHVTDIEIPVPFGKVSFDNNTLMKGVISDDLCRNNPCEHNGTCAVTWNDFKCKCTRGFKGKTCSELEFCEMKGCPEMSQCRNLEDGYECIANSTFTGKTKPLTYNFFTTTFEIQPVFDTIEINYRTKIGGTVMYVQSEQDYFFIFVNKDEVTVQWNLIGKPESYRFTKGNQNGDWNTLYFTARDIMFYGGFKEIVLDDIDISNIVVNDFNVTAFSELFSKGTVYLGGSEKKSYEFLSLHNQYKRYNGTSYITNNSVTESNTIDLPINTLPTELPLTENIRDKFKGCLGEIRIGDLLLPYFTTETIYSNNNTAKEFFSLGSNSTHSVGCRVCFEDDCLNNGHCLDAEVSYNCSCAPGYTAEDCSVDIDECLENKCQNNSTCVDGIANFTCICQNGYEGWLCDTEIDECQSNPCRNGGTCRDLLANYECFCTDDFVGRQCEARRLITCENQPCRNGSTCTDGPNMETRNNFTCSCMKGMVGALCDTPFCVAEPCKHGGECNVSEVEPFCQCRSGYTGRFCEEDIDDCILPTGDSPCQHDGQCIDEVDKYSCNCTNTGYKGLICELDVDECEDEYICGTKDGACENTPGSFICHCPPNLCGIRCALPDPCQTAPCGERGTCVPTCRTEASFECNCTTGYYGTYCNETVVAQGASDDSINIALIVIPIVAILLLGGAAGLAVLIAMARSKRATRGTYSPSAQEFCNPRVELDHVLKPPPEERLI